MMFILFNAFGDQFSPSILKRKFSLAEFEVFEKGSPMSRGKALHKQSGLACSLESVLDSEQLVQRIGGFIEKNAELLAELRKEPIEMAFNVGLTVGSSDSYVPCLNLDAAFLRVLAQNQAGLNILGYPTSN